MRKPNLETSAWFSRFGDNALAQSVSLMYISGGFHGHKRSPPAPTGGNH